MAAAAHSSPWHRLALFAGVLWLVLLQALAVVHATHHEIAADEAALDCPSCEHAGGNPLPATLLAAPILRPLRISAVAADPSPRPSRAFRLLPPARAPPTA